MLHLNRIAFDRCSPTADRRPTTEEDIRNDVQVKNFKSPEDLYKFVLDLTNNDDEEVSEELPANASIYDKVDYCLGFLSDCGDGSPNVFYCVVDGEECIEVYPYDSLEHVDFDTVTSKKLQDLCIDFED